MNADGTGDVLILATEGEVYFIGQASDGRLVYRVVAGDTQNLYSVNPDGSELQTILETPVGARYNGISLSPTGDFLFLQRDNSLLLTDLTFGDGIIVARKPAVSMQPHGHLMAAK